MPHTSVRAELSLRAMGRAEDVESAKSRTIRNSKEIWIFELGALNGEIDHVTNQN